MRIPSHSFLLSAILIIIIYFSLAACDQASTEPSQRATRKASQATSDAAELSSKKSELTKLGITDDDDPEDPPWRRFGKVSAHDLDDKKFFITRFVVGLQKFIDSETPFLVYEKPKDADYVEIMRCKSQAIISGGLDTIRLEDIEISNLSISEKDRMYRNNDFFTAASKNTSACTIISNGSMEKTFYDSWAPNGSFRYLMRSCVSNERLTDKDQLSNRNCSKQIGISNELKDYTNLRSEGDKAAAKQIDELSVQLDGVIRSLSEKGQEAGIELDACAEREHNREVFKKRRDAITTMVAIGLDIMLEFRTAEPDAWGNGVGNGLKKTFKHYVSEWTSFGAWMDRIQMAGAVGGYTFRNMFVDLTAGVEDMPRTCEAGVRLSEEIKNLSLQFEAITNKKMQYVEQANTKAMGNKAAAGEGIAAPKKVDAAAGGEN
ncbi:MAG: hypothetical protein KA436_00190 [Oligoflexales bacterium]|nr:hypothetical protein [Oligoflexales bacterium]